MPREEAGVTVPVDAGDRGSRGAARRARRLGGAAGAAAPAAEPCKDLKQAQARAVLGQSAKLAEKQVVRQRVCTVKAGGSVALTVRSDSATDFDWVVAGLKENPANVKQLKTISVGDKGYSYDRYDVVNGKPTFIAACALLQGRRADLLARGAGAETAHARQASDARTRCRQRGPQERVDAEETRGRRAFGGSVSRRAKDRGSALGIAPDAVFRDSARWAAASHVAELDDQFIVSGASRPDPSFK